MPLLLILPSKTFLPRVENRRKTADRSKVISPLDKEAWLKLAGDWLSLADDADLREKPR